jgi:hypothetical protein
MQRSKTLSVVRQHGLRIILHGDCHPGDCVSKDLSDESSVLTTFDSTATATVFSTTTASTATLINVNTIVSTTTETIEVTTVPTILATTVVTNVIVLTVPSTLVPTTVTEATVVTVQEKRAVSPTGGRHMLEYQNASLAPRQVTIAPSRVPTYASACSGTVRYSSVCSCIGVTYSTITVAAPTTTKTTTIAITNTASTTVQTSTVVQDVSLTTVVITNPTTIITTIETEVISSQIVVTTVAAATVDVTSTFFLCPNPTPSFYLQAVVAYDGGFNTQVIQLETSIDNAALFYLDGSGHLTSGNSIANIDSSPGETIFFNTAA